MKFVVAVLMVVVFISSGCAVCTTQTTRCNGNVAEMCDSRGRWRVARNCDEVVFESGAVPECRITVSGAREVHTCLPQEE